MDTITDFSKLNLEELFELQELQGKMGQPEDLSKLTLDELRRLERLSCKMAGMPAPVESTWKDLNEDANDWPHEYKWQAPAGYVPVIMTRSGVAAASKTLGTLAVTSQPEPVAVAPAPAPAASATPATPAPAEKLKPPSDSVLSAARQLDSLMRFGA